jgi:Uncharacterized conserved protein (DUF2303)
MPEAKLQTDAQAILDAGEKLAQDAVRTLTFEGVPTIAFRDGYRIERHPELLEHPRRRTGFVEVASLDSFCAFFNRFKSFYKGQPIIMVDADPAGKRGSQFKAALNYHGDEPDHGDFGVIYTAALSVEWLKWMSKNNVPLQHAAFLEHLEDVMNLIETPPAADLMKLLSDLSGTKDARFSNALNLFNGRMKLNYEEDVIVRGASIGLKPGDVEVPTEIVAGLAPFEYGQKYVVKNRIRYRVANRQLTFSYEAIDPHKVIQHAVNEEIKFVAEKTEHAPLAGKI